jgi:hypothetical protein
VWESSPDPVKRLIYFRDLANFSSGLVTGARRDEPQNSRWEVVLRCRADAACVTVRALDGTLVGRSTRIRLVVWRNADRNRQLEWLIRRVVSEFR